MSEQKRRLAALSPKDVHCVDLAGGSVTSITTEAPDNHAPIGGVKVTAASGWFAARASGTEDIDRIYAESFRGKDALDRIVEQAYTIVDAALAVARSTGSRGVLRMR